MTTVIAFILILSFLIFVHELGHFLTAKRAGIVVEEFGIGYPPRAVKLWQGEGKISLDGHEFVIGKKTKVPKNLQTGAQITVETKSRDDGKIEVTKIEIVDDPEQTSSKPTVEVESFEKPTEYTLNWIPFGGFVKMLGEEDPSAPGSFASKSKRTRFVVLVAGAVMNLITAVIVFAIMFATGRPEAIGPTFVTEVAPNSPAAMAGLQVDDFILQVDDFKVQSAEGLIDFTNAHKGKEVTLIIERDGEEIQTSLIPRKHPPEGEGAMGIGIFTQYSKMHVTDVVAGSVADKAGIQIGDILLQVDDWHLTVPVSLNSYLHEFTGKPVTFTVERDGQRIQLPPIVPTESPAVNVNAPALELDADISAIGVHVQSDEIQEIISKQPIGKALVSGVDAMVSVVVQTFSVPIQVIRQVIPAEQARPVGPAGIYQITDAAVKASQRTNMAYPILFLMAILSTALGVTNLLPLPALDGGRILFVIIEAIRGKRVSPEREGAIHFMGMMLLLGLMVLISYYDVSSPIDASGLFR